MNRKWVIGDIHGCFYTLKALIENQIQPGNTDILYFLGDYIDRGPRSKEVIQYLQKLSSDGLSVIPLMGNHEEAMLNAWEEELNPKKRFFLKRTNSKKTEWYSFGGKQTMNSYTSDDMNSIPDQDIQWLKSLRHYAEEENYLLVHAGFNFNKENIFEDIHAMHWIRDFDTDLKKTGGKKVIHGHVPVTLELIEQFIQSKQLNFIDLDNGCVYSDRPGMGNLVAFELITKELKVQKYCDF